MSVEATVFPELNDELQRVWRKAPWIFEAFGNSYSSSQYPKSWPGEYVWKDGPFQAFCLRNMAWVLRHEAVDAFSEAVLFRRTYEHWFIELLDRTDFWVKAIHLHETVPGLSGLPMINHATLQFIPQHLLPIPGSRAPASWRQRWNLDDPKADGLVELTFDSAGLVAADELRGREVDDSFYEPDEIIYTRFLVIFSALFRQNPTSELLLSINRTLFSDPDQTWDERDLGQAREPSALRMPTLPIPLPFVETEAGYLRRVEALAKKQWQRSTAQLESQHIEKAPRGLRAKDKWELHYHWYVRYQVLGHSYAEIGKAFRGRPDEYGDRDQLSPSTIHQAVQQVAQDLELPLRKGRTSTRP